MDRIMMQETHFFKHVDEALLQEREREWEKKYKVLIVNTEWLQKTNDYWMITEVGNIKSSYILEELLIKK